MDITSILDGVLPGLSDQQQLAVLGAVAVVIVAAVAAVIASVVRRRRRRPQALDTDPDRGIIRHPLYVDPVRLDDLLGHVETRDFSSGLQSALETGDPDRRPEEVRKLNKVIVGLRQRADLLLDIDRDPEAELEEGRAVLVTGSLSAQPASEAAELLELSAPLLAGGGQTVTPPTRFLRLHPDVGGDRTFLLVLDPEGTRGDELDLSSPSSVTVLGVVEEQLDARDRVDLGDRLAEHLSPDVRRALGDQDAGAVAAHLSSVTPAPLKRKELVFDGPGARLGVAAIFR